MSLPVSLSIDSGEHPEVRGKSVVDVLRSFLIRRSGQEDLADLSGSLRAGDRPSSVSLDNSEAFLGGLVCSRWRRLGLACLREGWFFMVGHRSRAMKD